MQQNLKNNKKQLLIQIYVVIFILLNILDFFNFLSGDLDILKKFLSWIIIGWIFYKVGILKIFIGKDLPRYDLIYLFSFILISIPRSLFYILTTTNKSGHILFFYLIKFARNLLGSQILLIVDISFLIGIFIIIFTTIFLLRNNLYTKDSFIGSFNFSKYQKFMKFDYIILILILSFFGIVIFNLIMEWFALAVDSLILILGLIYYTYKLIKNHTNTKFSNHLNEISHTGEEFYEKLIKTFSDKKTIFIGLSFLLTMHLLVDMGVYGVSYIFGIQNNLYSGIYTQILTHQSIFNIINPTKSLFFLTLNQISLFPFLTLRLYFYLTSFFIYFGSLILLIIFLITPFFIYYKNINKQKFNYSKFFIVIFLSLVIMFSMLNFSNKLDKTIPISIDTFHQISIKGVDIQTHQINFFNNKLLIFLLSSIPIFLLSFIFLWLLFSKFSNIEIKIFYFIILIFFIYYIFLFYTNEISTVIYKTDLIGLSQSNIFLSSQNINNSKWNYLQNLENKNLIFTKKILPSKSIKSGSMEIFTNKNISELVQNSSYKLYSKFNIKITSNYLLFLKNFSKNDVIFFDKLNFMNNKGLIFQNISFIIPIPKNSLKLISKSQSNYIITKNLTNNLKRFKIINTSKQVSFNFNILYINYVNFQNQIFNKTITIYNKNCEFKIFKKDIFIGQIYCQNQTSKFENSKFELIYPIFSNSTFLFFINKTLLNKLNSKNYLFSTNGNLINQGKIINKYIQLIPKYNLEILKQDFQNIISNIINYIRLFMLSFFYIFSLLIFIYFFSKENIFK